MSITGEPDGPPMKVGVAVSDIVCGLYASVAVLGALRHRDATGRGQHIDLGLLDTQVGWLMNQGLNYLIVGKGARAARQRPSEHRPLSGVRGRRRLHRSGGGQRRPVPAVLHFRGEKPSLAEDRLLRHQPRKGTQPRSSRPLIETLIRAHPVGHWVEGLESVNVPCGPVNSLDQVFADLRSFTATWRFPCGTRWPRAMSG